MHIDCWVKRLTYGVFKELFGSGMQLQLMVSLEGVMFYAIVPIQEICLPEKPP